MSSALTETPNNLNVTTSRRPRQRRCGVCGETGHDRRTCPTPEGAEQRRIREEQRELRYQQWIETQREEEQQRREREQRKGIRRMRFFNNNAYDISIFYRMDVPGWENTVRTLGSAFENETPTAIYRHIQDVRRDGSSGFKVAKKTKVLIIPKQERYQYLTGEKNVINKNTYTGFVVGEYDIDDHDSENLYIIADGQYTAKTVLEQWKECGLKAMYLLQQLERLGASNNDNLEPIMDLVQDIIIPSHNYMDRENAGVPSAFTNLT